MLKDPLARLLKTLAFCWSNQPAWLIQLAEPALLSVPPFKTST